MGILRTLLALAVVSAHYGIPLPFLGEVPFYSQGAFAVSGFFIVSGFYMSMVISEKYKANWRQFYLSRLLRLGPILGMMLLAHMALALVTHTTTFGGWAHPNADVGRMLHKIPFVWKLVVISANTTTIGTDALNFVAFDANGGPHLQQYAPTVGQMPGSAFSLFPPGWSLSIEIVFYLLAPFVVRRRFGVIAGLIAVSLVVRAFVWGLIPGSYVWDYAFLPGEWVFFMLGICGYRLYLLVKDWQWAHLVGYVLFGIFLCVFWTMNHMKIQEIFAYYCCFLTLAVPFIFCSFKSNKTDRAIGNFAYIIFAVHFISGKLVMMIPYHVTVDLFYPMLFTVALATYYGIEVPVENFRARVNGLMRKSAPRAVAVAVAAELKPGARAMPVVQDRPSI